jgi:hypothetical protein
MSAGWLQVLGLGSVIATFAVIIGARYLDRKRSRKPRSGALDHRDEPSGPQHR